MSLRPPLRICAFLSLVLLAACGGGGGSSTGASSPSSNGASETATPGTPASTAEPATPASTTTTPTPVTLATATAMLDGTTLGTANWAAGSTATGGVGQAVGTLNCATPGDTYTYAHLSIYYNGQPLTIPASIGRVEPTIAAQTGCVYPVHTDDGSGKIRIDATNTAASYTLGQFFAVWGEPLTASNVAGLSGTPTTYINDGGVLTPYTGDLASINLTAHREITIAINSPLTQVPTYTWTDPPPFATTSPIVLLYGGVVGNAFWPNGSTATGGTGAPVDDIVCAAGMTETYHVHAHLAIYRDGQMLALPAHIGLPASCNYEMHTHDNTGIIHIETPNLKQFTLGKFFDIWGETLSSTDVAGVTGTVVAYINENGDVRRYTGDLRDIELTSHRDITLQIGTDIPSLPTYNWYEPK
jgi:hypothetical protein